MGPFLIMLSLPAICRADADKIYKENSPMVVVVVSLDGQGHPTGLGSGFLVREDGAVVTNYHVISMASGIKIKAGSMVRDVEGILDVDPENDLAILKMAGKDFPKVTIGDANKLQVGEKVYVIGSPQGLENTISEGILSGVREVSPGRKVLQMTAAISPGSSGGPVFNERGEVVGIATFLIADTQNLNFALPVNLVIPGLSKKELVSTQNACQVDYNGIAACWYYQGLAWGAAGKYDKAEDAFKHSLTIDSKNTDAYVNLGVSYAKQGKHEEAIRMLTQALKIEPNQPEALNMLGAAYSDMGNYKEAVTVLKKSLALEPGNARTYYNLAITYGKTDQDAQAMEAVKEAIRLEPKLPEAHGYLGVEYARMGKYPEAAAAFKAAIRLGPDDPRMHFGLGKVYALTGDKASALEEYKILKRLNPAGADELFELIYR